MELINSIRKCVYSLDSVRSRRELGLFKAEGLKCVSDTLGHFDLEMLIVSHNRLDELVKSRSHVLDNIDSQKIVIASNRDFERMSSLATPSDIIAVYRIPDRTVDFDNLKDKLVLALDCIQDPGNLGTIIRAADWFGVTDILCSEDTADPYAPKTVMASMGAIARVRPVKCNLHELLKKTEKIIYGTFLDGDNIYQSELSQDGIIVMGNEGKGISSEIAAIVDKKLLIPAYLANRPTSESLNVGMATSIILSEFRRRTI